MENKEDIVKRLKLLLMATRAGSDIEDLILSVDQKMEKIVTIQFRNGYTKNVCVEADSGIELIRDVIKKL